MLRLRARPMLWFLAGLILQSCAVGTPVTTYLLSAAIPPAGLHRSSGPTLLVSPPRSAAGYDRPQIAYVRLAPRIDYYAHNQWADEPARLLEPILVGALEAGGGLRSVLGAASGLPADLRLDTEILALHHEIVGATGRGRIVLRVQLVDLDRGEVLATRHFDRAVPVSSQDAPGGVAAINAALQDLLPQLVAFVNANVP